MSDFRKSYLQPEAEPWVRELEQRVIALEKKLQIAEQNNAAADAQLRTSYNRLDLAYNNLEELLLNTVDTVNYLESTQPYTLTPIPSQSWSTDTEGDVIDVDTDTIDITVPAGGRKYCFVAFVNVSYTIETFAGDDADRGQSVYLHIGDGVDYPNFQADTGDYFYVYDVDGQVDHITFHERNLALVAEYDLEEGVHNIPIALQRSSFSSDGPYTFYGNSDPVKLLVLPDVNENIASETLATTKIARK